MTRIDHLNCVRIISSIGVEAIGHCLLLEDDNGLALVDVGIGLLDTHKPMERIGRDMIEMIGYQFDESLTAYRQVEQLGLNPNDITHCIITHLDPDHIGGLVDFPHTKVHVSFEELENFNSGNRRYLPLQLDHKPEIQTYKVSQQTWFGLESRRVNINFESDIFLIPLFGHTLGHCGVAIAQGDRWLFYIGDAYYLPVELTDSSHPVNQLAMKRADDNELRLSSIDRIKKLIKAHANIDIFSFHDKEGFLAYTEKESKMTS